MSIEEMAKQIKITESEIQSISSQMQEEERSGENSYSNLINILEEKTEFLIVLKKNYNNLYNKLNKFDNFTTEDS